MMGTSVNSQTGTHNSHSNSACQLFPIFREREKEGGKKAKEHDKCERRRKDEKLIENPILLFQKKRRNLSKHFTQNQKKNLFLAIFKLKNKKQNCCEYMYRTTKEENEQLKKGEEEE